MTSPERGDDAWPILGLLLGNDDPLAVGLDRDALAQPDCGGRGGAVHFGAEHELPALLDLRHLGEVGLDGRLDRDDLEDGLAGLLPGHVLGLKDDLLEKAKKDKRVIFGVVVRYLIIARPISYSSGKILVGPASLGGINPGKEEKADKVPRSKLENGSPFSLFF